MVYVGWREWGAPWATPRAARSGNLEGESDEEGEGGDSGLQPHTCLHTWVIATFQDDFLRI